jgi:hypothetical protein
MVTGMETFKQHFAGFEEAFVLIGGAACDAWFPAISPLGFRALFIVGSEWMLW